MCIDDNQEDEKEHQDEQRRSKQQELSQAAAFRTSASPACAANVVSKPTTKLALKNIPAGQSSDHLFLFHLPWWLFNVLTISPCLGS